jgi:hypothetical protein
MTPTLPPEPPLQQVISDLFRDFKGDETGGQHANRGFSFQVWQAVLEALRAHATPADYAVVLEWQQDIAVMNSSSQPTTVKFMQLKKNESSVHWKLSALVAPDTAGVDAANDAPDSPAAAATAPALGKSKTKAPKKPKPSILAKLYFHRRRFKSLAQARLEFVSNVPFEIPDGTGGTLKVETAQLHALPESVRSDIETKLREQLQLADSEQVDLQDFALVVTDCPVSEPQRYVAGAFAEMQLTGDMQLSAKATMLAVLVIASYVNLRAGKTRFAKDLPELLGRAVTRADLDQYFAAANDHTIPTSDHVQAVVNRLNMELAPAAMVRNMRREMSRACVNITNRASPAPMVAAHLKALYVANGEYADLPKVTDQFDRWHADIQKLAPPDLGLYNREYLYCLMAMISEDANPTKQLPPVPSGAQSEDAQ